MLFVNNSKFSFALSGKNGKGKFAVVDKKHESKVRKFDWKVQRDGYVYAAVNQKFLLLARYIMEMEMQDCNMEVDHADQDKLNNTVANLRLSSRQENCCNRKRRANNQSGYIGVWWSKKGQSWEAGLGWTDETTKRHKRKFLGYYKEKDDAARAYNRALRSKEGVREEFKIYNKINGVIEF